MLLNKKITLFALLALLLFNSAIAQQDALLFNFKFNHLSGLNTSGFNATGFEHADSVDAAKFSQSDITMSYPWDSKNVNIDLGLTVRHLSGFKKSSFQSTLPLLHASALYNFSFSGLTAGIEGNHAGPTNKRLFDYKAKVSYEWRNGFGMRGGWQHQQFNLDAAAATLSEYELKGPYLDFYLNF